ESGLGRSDLFITSKYTGIGPVEQAIQDSLTNIGVAQLDLYLIHSPELVGPDTWARFEDFQKAGLTKSIGVSNYDLETLQELIKNARVVPAVNQISLSPYTYSQHKGLIEYAAKHNIVIEAYSSLSPIIQYPSGPVDKPVAAAAKRLGATPTQVILSWVRSKGAVIVTTSSRKDRMQEYLDVGDLPPLLPEEIQAIDEAGANGPPTSLARSTLSVLQSLSKPVFLDMFSTAPRRIFSAFTRSTPQISIFHNPSSPPSQSALRLLNASISSPYPPNAKHPLKFNLEVIENQPPTPDQLRTILSYASASPDSFVSAHPSTASSSGSGRTAEDVASLAKSNPNALKWPIVVNWDSGRAAVGDLEGVKSILEELRKQRDGE
ncbi:hypothetical protein EIP91_004425, partial [Steccherinum ochraceum]